MQMILIIITKQFIRSKNNGRKPAFPVSAKDAGMTHRQVEEKGLCQENKRAKLLRPGWNLTSRIRAVFTYIQTKTVDHTNVALTFQLLLFLPAHVNFSSAGNINHNFGI